tara:strand:+ start:174 stop:398 length:225 start_codon:yes stop_codon:yes gene_type:complete
MFDVGYVVVIEDFPGFPLEKVSGIFETREEAEDEAFEYGENNPYLSDYLEVITEDAFERSEDYKFDRSKYHDGA